MKIEATKRLCASKQDKEDAARYRAIREAVQSKKTLTLKAATDEQAFDRAIDKVLRG